MISRNFLKSSLIYTLAGILPMASAVILLPVYMYYLPLEVYGVLSICIPIAILTQILVTFSFDLAVYVNYPESKKNPERFAAFISSAIIAIAGLGLIVVIFSTITGPLIADHFLADKGLNFFPYGFLSVLTGIFQAFFKVYSNLLQSRQQPERYLVSNVVSFAIIVMLTIVGLVYFPKSLVGPVGARAVAAFVSGAWATSRVFREFGIHFKFDVIKSTFSFNTSQYIYQMQQWVINYFDRIVITFYLTFQDVGAYDFAFKCLLAIDLIMGGLHSAILPKVLGQLAEVDKKQSTPEINRYYHGLVAISMILVIAALVFAPWFFKLEFIDIEYRDAIQYIPLLSIVYLVRSIRYYFSFPYGALKFSKPLPGIYLGISIFKIGIMVAFIERIGVPVVIVSAIASGLFEILLLRFFIQERFLFKFNKFKLVFAPLLLALIVGLVEVIDPPELLSTAVYLLVCAGLLWFLYRKELLLINPKKLFRLK